MTGTAGSAGSPKSTPTVNNEDKEVTDERITYRKEIKSNTKSFISGGFKTPTDESAQQAFCSFYIPSL
jgi:hypothetical protein